MHRDLIPPGFKDDVSSQVATEHIFKNIIIKNFLSNGFTLVKTPLIDYVSNETDKNTFKILSPKNRKKLNIRDDITLQVARLSQNRLSKKNRPLKLCYYGEVVRKNGSMLRPERQFLQIGAECIGDKNFLADVEMLELAYNSLLLVGIKNIIIEISSRIFYDKFLSTFKSKYNKAEIKRLIKLKDLGSLLKILDQKDHEYIKNLFLCTGLYNKNKKNLKNLSVDNSTSIEIDNLNNIVKKFSVRNKNTNFFLDLCEVDDKNYHNGVRFTFYSKDIRGEVARGGRYFTKNLKQTEIATGFTCYMDSILRASSLDLVTNKILIPFDTNKNKVNNLIEKGYVVLKYTGNSVISKKIAKQQNSQFYLLNNSIKTS